MRLYMKIVMATFLKIAFECETHTHNFFYTHFFTPILETWLRYIFVVGKFPRLFVKVLKIPIENCYIKPDCNDCSDPLRENKNPLIRIAFSLVPTFQENKTRVLRPLNVAKKKMRRVKFMNGERNIRTTYNIIHYKK